MPVSECSAAAPSRQLKDETFSVLRRLGCLTLAGVAGWLTGWGIHAGWGWLQQTPDGAGLWNASSLRRVVEFITSALY